MSSAIDDIATKSAAEIGRAIASGAVDPLALTERLLAAAAARDDVFVRLTPERARRAALAARNRARAGLRRGPLDGVPVSWKDLFDMAGVPTEAGSALRRGAVADRDAALIARADAAGLVPLGKTHLSELAFSGLGYNPVTATPPNAFDAARAPGGSSSGAAASIALNLAPAAIGTDTGGSVRIPAAWNGLVGLKTTAGRLPMTGVTPLSPTLDTAGPLARSVEDAALLDAALAGETAPDLDGATLKNRRFLVAESRLLDDLDPDLAAGFEAALERLAAAGAILERAPVPELAEALDTASRDGAIVNTEGYAVWKEEIEAAPDAMFPLVRERFRSGAAYTADQIDRARLRFAALARRVAARAAGADAVLTPTTPNKAPLLTDLTGSDAVYLRENLASLRLTRLANLFRFASLALPAGRAADGHPVSLMLTGPAFSERRLLRIGAAAERALRSSS